MELEDGYIAVYESGVEYTSDGVERSRNSLPNSRSSIFPLNQSEHGPRRMLALSFQRGRSFTTISDILSARESTTCPGGSDFFWVTY